jgi:hypothetical protein
MKKSAHPPAQLIDRYVQAVRFWMPKGEEDVLAELSEDLYSQLDTKEEELGRPLVEDEVAAILKKCSSPIVMAGKLRPQSYLIGPTWFPVYRFILKTSLLWILIPIFIFIVGPVNYVESKNLGLTILRTLGQLWPAGFIAAGIITVVFVVLERAAKQFCADDRWNPKSLPPLEKPQRKTSKVPVVCELIFNVLGFVWLLLLPSNPFLILGPAARILSAAPTWHRFYVPFLLLALAAVARSAIVLVRPDWSRFPAWSQWGQTVLWMIVLNYMMNVAEQTTGAAWHPFVIATSGLEQHLRMAAVLNASILVSIACAWLGLCTALVVQTWQSVRLFRKANHPVAPSLSAHVL